jgi:hypothetical protein
VSGPLIKPELIEQNVYEQSSEGLKARYFDSDGQS